MKKVPKVLVCPLDWGIGHATRCVPVIRQFRNAGFEVIIGADKKPYHFLKQEFPNLKIVRFSGTEISYSSGTLLWLKMLFSVPRLLLGICKEHRQLKNIIDQEDIDVVFSDNRYGLWNKKIYSIFMTHQTNIQFPGKLKLFKGMANRVNRYFINKFDRLWIPDAEGTDSISGELSNAEYINIPTKRVGILSRFNELGNEIQNQPIELLAILSGPEPQRTLFEKKLVEEIKALEIKATIIRGLPGIEEKSKKDNILYISHLESETLANYIKSAKLVICRPGYSSLMDLACLGISAIVVPTPGQTEQEYLAEQLDKKKIHLAMNQNLLDLKVAFDSISNYSGLKIKNDYTILKDELQQVLDLL